TSQFPITLNTGTGLKARIAMAQHPADGSLWLFYEQDSTSRIGALHFTESPGGLTLNWSNLDYIYYSASDPNFPNNADGEWPFLAAAPDPTRNAIQLAYQSKYLDTWGEKFVYVDPLFGGSSGNKNGIFLREGQLVV